MKAELKQKWIEALRSGEYKQGRTYFRSAEGYCCLGVLAEVSGKRLELYRSGPWEHVEAILAKEGGYDMAVKLYEMNDGCEAKKIKQHSFPEIADYIEANIPEDVS